ncbi:MAG: MotA/TolQ/ExbB proton channel family protein [Desulfamplus sp.]|nr:MotA/TolQ/ExbB proton channel family protein [Desulfamplus sp.]
MFDMFLKGGPLMWPILLCSFLSITISLKKGFQFQGVLKELSCEIEMIIKKNPSYLAPIFDAVNAGKTEKEVGFIATHQIRLIEKGLGFLALVAVISPLLGLTGTVTGMIKSFQIIALSQTQINPGMLAGGIWEALITTAAGLFVAIPTHVVCHFLENQVDEIALIAKESAIFALQQKECNAASSTINHENASTLYSQIEARRHNGD